MAGGTTASVCDLLTGEAVVTPEEHSQLCSFHPTPSLLPQGCFQTTRPEQPRGVPGGASSGGRNWKLMVTKEQTKHPLPFYLLIYLVFNLCLNSLCHRYYFKKASDEFDCGAVFEEVWEDETILPMYEGRILGKVERID